MGFGSSNSKNNTRSDIPESASKINLDFSLQTVNSALENVLAINTTDANTSEYANLEYLDSSTPNSLDLNTINSDSVSFSFQTGASNQLYNGYSSEKNSRLYLPIMEIGKSKVTYLVVEKALSTNQLTSFLYVDGIGSFNETNNFNFTFTATNLTETGLTLDLSFAIGSPVSVPKPTQEVFDFTTEDVNSQVGSVIACNITNRDETYFSDLAYTKKASPSILELQTNTELGQSFIITQYGNTTIKNGFDQNGHFYVPIRNSTVTGANYLELETATSDTGVTNYLYLDAIGYFDSDKNFKKPFIAHNLLYKHDWELTLSTDGNPENVPIPEENILIAQRSFLTQNLGGAYGATLHTQLQTGDDVSSFIYLDYTDVATLKFESPFITGTLDVKMKTTENNLAIFKVGVLYMPIDQILLNSVSYNYLTLEVTVIGGARLLYFDGLSADAKQSSNILLFQQLDNIPSVNLELAIGN